MTRTLYDPAVEKRGYDAACQEAQRRVVREGMAMNLDDAVIRRLGGLTQQQLEELKKEITDTHTES